MKMKKILSLAMCMIMTGAVLTGCSSSSEGESSAAASSSTAAASSAAAEETTGGAISVISREDGSGTRGAFVELLGIEEEIDGQTVDATTQMAEITNSTSVMMTTVAGNVDAIGYISLGSLNDTVKALKIDGAEATVDNIKSGTYKVSRPFNVAVKEGLSEAATDFVNFILSDEGQAVVEEAGYISQGSTGAFAGTNPEGKVTVSGSSSVTPVMEKLKEAYVAVNPNVEIEIQQSDSSTGVQDAISGTSDLGMASRELKDSELSEGVSPIVIALDGIAVIVNNDNAVSELTSEQVQQIYLGEITDWADLSK